MCSYSFSLLFFFFFNDTATTEIYTLSLHDALPIRRSACPPVRLVRPCRHRPGRSEEHTSELQSHVNLVCRLLLEKKKTNVTVYYTEKQVSTLTEDLEHYYVY